MKIVFFSLTTILIALSAPMHAADAPASAPAATPLAVQSATPSASPSATPAKPKAFGGKVSAVTDSSITVSNRNLGDQTFKTDAGTKFFGPNRTVISLSDIKVGTRVRVKPGASPDVAAVVMIVVPKVKATPTPAPDASASPAASPAVPASSPAASANQ